MKDEKRLYIKLRNFTSQNHTELMKTDVTPLTVGYIRVHPFHLAFHYGLEGIYK